jgi:hypothetical protein
LVGRWGKLHGQAPVLALVASQRSLSACSCNLGGTKPPA